MKYHFLNIIYENTDACPILPQVQKSVAVAAWLICLQVFSNGHFHFLIFMELAALSRAPSGARSCDAICLNRPVHLLNNITPHCTY